MIIPFEIVDPVDLLPEVLRKEIQLSMTTNNLIVIGQSRIKNSQESPYHPIYTCILHKNKYIFFCEMLTNGNGGCYEHLAIAAFYTNAKIVWNAHYTIPEFPLLGLFKRRSWIDYVYYPV